MKTKTIELFEYSELSKEAFKKAHSDWQNDCFDNYAVQVSLDNHIEDLLEKHGITMDEQGTYPKIYWSLSHSQGDGVMFEGNFKWKRYTIYIKQHGRYTHSNSASIEIQETKNLGFHMDDEHRDVKKFDKIYHEICKELERYGYETIEYEQSEAAFADACNANEYYFTKDGKLEDDNQ